MLFPATAMGKDLAPRAAAKLDAGLASDCIHCELEGGTLKVKRPVYAGKAFATVAFSGKKKVAEMGKESG